MAVDLRDEIRKAMEDIALRQDVREACFQQSYSDGIFGTGLTEADARKLYTTEIYDQNKCQKYVLNFLPYAKTARVKRIRDAKKAKAEREEEQTTIRGNRVHYNRAVGVAAFGLAALLGSCAMSVSPESKKNIADIAGAAALTAGPLLVLYGLSKRK